MLPRPEILPLAEAFMSSSPLDHLPPVDLQFLQKILTDAEYTSKISNIEPRDVAAKLLVKLFQEGVRDPDVLSSELRKHFGYLPIRTHPHETFEKNRKVMQGITTTRVPTAKKVPKEPTSQAPGPRANRLVGTRAPADR
jgi:hypothetical protein